MKKLLITLVAAASLVSVNVNAQEKVGGASATGSTIGGIAVGTAAAAAAAAAVAAALVANSSGTAKETIIVEPPVEETCSGSDELADGVCIGTTVTVTQTGTGTMTSTVTVPVTFTYAPTLQ